jgi:UDPglucose 6-dehydrogenase
MEINQKQKEKMIEPLKNYFDGDLKGKTIAIWGLAFKPYTDDIREAPALENITKLLSLGAKVKAYDPEAMENVKEIFGDKIYFAQGEYDAVADADALMIMTEWPVFRTPEFDKLAQLLKNKVIFDGRNLYDLKQMEDEGFTYHSVGRKIIKA